MQQYVCCICGKEMSRWNALRIGGMVEQVTKKRFICRACSAGVQSGDITIRVVKNGN